MTWAGLGHLEGKAALPQTPQDPVLGADLRDGQEPSDRQHVALLPVAHQERPVVGPLFADGGDAHAGREAPQGQQRGGELQADRCRLALLGRSL